MRHQVNFTLMDCALSKERVRTDVVPMVMSIEDCARQRGDLANFGTHISNAHAAVNQRRAFLAHDQVHIGSCYANPGLDGSEGF